MSLRQPQRCLLHHWAPLHRGFLSDHLFELSTSVSHSARLNKWHPFLARLLWTSCTNVIWVCRPTISLGACSLCDSLAVPWLAELLSCLWSSSFLSSSIPPSQCAPAAVGATHAGPPSHFLELFQSLQLDPHPQCLLFMAPLLLLPLHLFLKQSVTSRAACAALPTNALRSSL